MATFLDSHWFERAFSALQETFRVDKRTLNDMVQFMFDEGFYSTDTLTFEAAVKKFQGCLNRHKADVNFKSGELVALQQRFERHHFFLWMADELGYEVRRKSTEERGQELLARNNELLELLLNTLDSQNGERQRLLLSDLREQLHRPGGPRPSFSKDWPCP